MKTAGDYTRLSTKAYRGDRTGSGEGASDRARYDNTCEWAPGLEETP